LNLRDLAAHPILRFALLLEFDFARTRRSAANPHSASTDYNRDRPERLENVFLAPLAI
jgi:hypothetical protein